MYECTMLLASIFIQMLYFLEMHVMIVIELVEQKNPYDVCNESKYRLHLDVLKCKIGLV